MLPNLLVINCYVFPLHRTARGDNVGTALSFVTANDDKILKKAEEELTKEFTGTRNIILLVLHSLFCVKHLYDSIFKADLEKE